MIGGMCIDRMDLQSASFAAEIAKKARGRRVWIPSAESNPT
ncbi:hypothetical protein LA76x_0515 [Lysobacter antibioticus]|uniref:Uncharacterized protein n=1 Tax=Lysobacter antibioticus TaxID=84531 RepID=A0A0S2F570_LYSAN|nr:hypothetical protein LA76x_0515 [Lysobacter antibioticus]